MIGKMVLLVEDNEDDIELTLRSFERQELPHEIVVARNGLEALEYLFQDESAKYPGPHRMPALILLDLKLPKIDGLEVLQKIKTDQKTKFIPVVILTTSSQVSDKIRSYDRGANSYIRKPTDYNLFKEVTRQLGQYWLKINESPPDTMLEEPAL